MTSTTQECTTCEKTAAETPNLKRCAKCKVTNYCSRECQTKDWKVHKKVCAKLQADVASAQNPNIEHCANYKSPKTTNLDVYIEKPFTALENKTYLDSRSEKDVFKLLINCFRMRQEDNRTHDAEVDADCVYNGAADSMEGFRRFMRLATKRGNLLPAWWNASKQDECEAFGMGNDWSSLKETVAKQDVIDHYGDKRMPMQLRMFAEFVYNRGPGGQSGALMRSQMVMMESNKDGKGGKYTSMMMV